MSEGNSTGTVTFSDSQLPGDLHILIILLLVQLNLIDGFSVLSLHFTTISSIMNHDSIVVHDGDWQKIGANKNIFKKYPNDFQFW